jgi:hypothetical protein
VLIGRIQLRQTRTGLFQRQALHIGGTVFTGLRGFVDACADTLERHADLLQQFTATGRG